METVTLLCKKRGFLQIARETVLHCKKAVTTRVGLVLLLCVPTLCDSAVNQSIERARPTVFVGSKPVIAYVVAALMELSKGREVAVKARGRSICRAVDTVQVIRTKYLSGSLKIKRIEFGSEPYPPEEGSGNRFVSCIEIILADARA